MRKANFCFEQNKKKEGLANWKAKKSNNQPEFKKKEFVPQRNFKNNKKYSHCAGGNDHWRTCEDYAQNKCSLGEPPS